LSFYIKLANIRWKQIWKGTDFVFGQMATPTFALMSEKIWNYRSIEKPLPISENHLPMILVVLYREYLILQPKISAIMF